MPGHPVPTWASGAIFTLDTFAGPCAGSGNKHDALRAEHLFRLVRQQCQKGLPVVIEASERSQVWNLQVVKQRAPLLHSSLHQWCNYEQLRHGHVFPCCSKLRLLTNFPVPNGNMCTCGDVQHVHAKDLGSQSAVRFEQVLRQLMHVVCKQKISNLRCLACRCQPMSNLSHCQVI